MHSWLLTCTTYGSWLPGDARWSYTNVTGSTRLTAPQPGLARHAQSLQKGPIIKLGRVQAKLVLAQFQETAKFRQWELHAASVMFNHFHVVISGPDTSRPEKILADLKAYGSRALNRSYGKPASRSWWTGKGSKRSLPDPSALEAAMNYVLHKQPNPLATFRAAE